MAIAMGLSLGAPSAASAAEPAVTWQLTSTSNTTASPGGSLQYKVQIFNVGESETNGEDVTFTATLPPGLTLAPLSVSTEIGGFSCEQSAQSVTCAGPAGFGPHINQTLLILAEVDPGANGTLTARFEVSGGGAPAAGQTADPVRISSQDPGFGIDAFDGLDLGPDGAAFTQAAGHPALLSTSYDFNTHTDPLIGPRIPVEDVKDISVEPPPGLVGSLVGLGQCTTPQISAGTGATSPTPECPISSQIGVLHLRTDRGDSGIFAIYNMVPPPGAPARFGINVAGTIVVLDTTVIGTGTDTHLRVTSANVPQGIVIDGNTLEFWGVPSDPRHDPERSCVGAGPPCVSTSPPQALFRNPGACSAEGLQTTIAADSWRNPGAFATDSYRSHQTPAYPEPEEEGPDGSMHRVWGQEVGIDGCAAVPFEPTLATSLTTNRADSPTGLAVDIGLPSACWEPKATPEEAEASICQSDLRSAQVSLPRGLTLNPSAAGALQACSPAQAGITGPPGVTPVAFDEAPVSCPDASKIGSVEIATPLLEDPLKGSVYLAQQTQNPFGSLLAMYLVAEGSGVRIKQAGQVSLDPEGGQITTSFGEVPQQPFSEIHVELFGGPRAALRTPPACGTYATEATLTPFSGNGATQQSSSFQITECPNSGFDPQLSAGTQNPLAATTSPFHLRLTRADGTSELGALSLALPPGLSGYLAGIPYCPDSVLAHLSTALGTGASQEQHPSCPPASQIGTTTVGAGSGPNPFYTSAGRVYLAGPYKGAPLSIAVLTPAVAGPFDLGTVLVRNALRIDQATTAITALSDPLPSILAGIPLDLRDIRIDLDRDHFTLNPTSCEPHSIAATLTSTTGATAQRSNHFQAAGCDRLGFKPKLTLALKGPVHRRAHPALSATYTARPGDANLARAQVKLPPAAFLDNAHTGAVCTRVQFAAQACPPGSVYGHAEATSPILGYPVEGPVYLRSSSHKLPDLVADLRGPSTQPIEVALAGKTDSVKGALRNTFELVPDAPVTRFHLSLFGKSKGLIEMSSGFCAHPRASVSLDAQNGRGLDLNPVVRAKCAKSGKKRHRRGRGR